MGEQTHSLAQPQVQQEPAALTTKLDQVLSELDAPVPDRREVATRLNQALGELPRDGGRPVADRLSALLDSKKLDDLVDWEGKTCRSAAAEALLSLGYPYALEVSPEDLEHLRQRGGLGTPAANLISGLGIVAATSGLEAVAHVPSMEGLVYAHAALTVTSAVAVALTRPFSRARRWAQGALILAGMEGIALSVFDAPAALLSGLAALVAAALMAKTR